MVVWMYEQWIVKNVEVDFLWVWHSVVGWVVLDVKKECCPFIFRSQAVWEDSAWATWPLKMKAPEAFETSGTTHPNDTAYYQEMLTLMTQVNIRNRSP